MPNFETESDRSALLADFSVRVNGDYTFDAIFDNEYVEFGEMQGTKPILTTPFVNPVTKLDFGSALNIEGVDYTVIRVESDATGWCIVVLEEV